MNNFLNYSQQSIDDEADKNYKKPSGMQGTIRKNVSLPDINKKYDTVDYRNQYDANGIRGGAHNYLKPSKKKPGQLSLSDLNNS